MTRWTPAEDVYLKQIARFPAAQIAQLLTERFGIQRTEGAVHKRRLKIVPDHQHEPIGFMRLSEIAWTTSKKHRAKTDPFVRRRAIQDGIITERILHNKRIELVPNAWANAIIQETATYRNEWLSTTQVAKILGLRKSEYVLNAYDSAIGYPALKACRRVQFEQNGYRWHPDDVAVAATEFRMLKARSRWLRRHWWNTKTAAAEMRVSYHVLRQIAKSGRIYWGVPLALLVREASAHGTIYYEPRSVRAFTVKMDEKRISARGKKKVGVDETPTRPDRVSLTEDGL